MYDCMNECKRGRYWKCGYITIFIKKFREFRLFSSLNILYSTVCTAYCTTVCFIVMCMGVTKKRWSVANRTPTDRTCTNCTSSVDNCLNSIMGTNYLYSPSTKRNSLCATYDSLFERLKSKFSKRLF